MLSLNTNVSYYKRAYLGALLSYAVVIYNSIGVTHKSISLNLLCDENVHYFVIAFYWYSYQPITGKYFLCMCVCVCVCMRVLTNVIY